MLNDKTILITGGTGSFGKKFLEMILENYNPHRVIIYSRDEYKQSVMKAEYSTRYDLSKVRFFIGDVRDKDRLFRAFDRVDYVIHAAAMKQVPTCEYNPFEAIKTNIHGAQNVIDAAIDRGVKKVVALSTDKAVNPINLYGGTKLVSDKLFILEQGVNLVFKALRESQGGETYISKIPSFRIGDLAKAMSLEVSLKEIGIREGEKLDEIMITKDDSRTTYEYNKHYIIYPHFEWWDADKNDKSGGILVPEGFEYTSANNKEWLSIKDIKELLKVNFSIE